MRHWPLLLSLALAACGTSTPSAPPDDTDAAPPPPLDPKLFDRTSLAGGLPPRVAASTPECLRDPKCKMRLVSGHRGTGGQLGRIAPEDTLAAYRAAIALGVDIVETDPRPTADGALVNVHDTTVDRTTDGKGTVDQMTLAQVQALHLTTGALAGDFSCEKIPTLRELLETCVGRALVLVDANKTDRVDLLVQAIEEAHAVDWAVFDTSSMDKIDRVLEPKLMIMPRIATLAEAPGILAHYKDHLPVLVEIDASIFPMTADLVHAAGTRTLTDAFGQDFSVKYGGDPAIYVGLYDRGADVLQSELPDLVLKALGRGR